MGLFDRFKKQEKSVEYTTEQLTNYLLYGTFTGSGKVHDPYTQIPIVYACINTKAMNICRLPILIYKGDRLIESGDPVNLMRRVNPQVSGRDFIYKMVSGINLKGNAYAYWDDIKANLPQYMIPIDTCKPKKNGNGWITSYELGSGRSTVTRPREQVLHVRYYSHNDMAEGTSPLKPLKKKIELAYAADKYNAAFFENDATPATAFTTDKILPEQELNRLKHELIARREGTRKSMVLHGGLDVKQLAITMKDADFVNLYKICREETCAVLGVPESELNIFTETKYSNAQTASTGFWEKTLIPEAEIISDAISMQVLEPAGFRMEFDFDSVDAIAKRGYGERVDQAVKLYGIGIPISALNTELDLGFDENTEWESRSPSLPVTVQDNTKTVKDKGNFNAFEHAQAQKWFKLEKSFGSIERQMAKALKDYFHRVEGKILRAIGSGKGSSWQLNKAYEEGDVRAAFDDKELEKICEELINKSITAGAAAIAGGNLYAEAAQEILQDKLIKIVDTNKTSRTVVIDKIRQAVKDSLDAGDGYQETAKKIKDAVGDAMDINRGRAETIARTEVGGAFNQAGYKMSTQDGAIGVRWISSQDATVRDTHQEYNGMVAKTGELFGGVISYPHAPDGPAGEVINCRCSFEPIYPGEEI